MHNIKEIRKDLDFFKKKISERNSYINFDELITQDKENRELIQQKEKKEQEKKLLSKSKDPTNFEKSKILSKEIDEIVNKHITLQNKISIILSSIPNIARDDVPVGINEKSNKIIKQKGNIKKFNFSIKSHVEIGEKNNQIDFKTSSNAIFGMLERIIKILFCKIFCLFAISSISLDKFFDLAKFAESFDLDKNFFSCSFFSFC